MQMQTMQQGQSGGEVPTHYGESLGYTTCNEMFDSDGYRYFVDGLLAKLHMTKERHLRLMPSPELSADVWEIIDHCAESGLTLVSSQK